MPSDEQIPEDVQRSWHNLARAAQAACKDNRGFAVLNFSVAVRFNEAILWSPPQITKLSPASAANVEINPELISVLVAFLQGGKVDTS